MSFIFKLLVFAQPGLHRQGGMGALEGLDAGLFIGTDHVGALLVKEGRFLIEMTDVADGGVKGVGIFFALVMKPIAYPMRFEIGFF